MKTFPSAKINLGLNVVERRADGYHNLETVFLPVPLCDELEVEVIRTDCGGDQDCLLTVGHAGIDEAARYDTGDAQRNLVVKAYRMLKEDFPDMPRVKARLLKNIPTQAGMGGGSSDCASMLMMLNELCALGLSQEQLMDYAARLGADCPIFILNHAAYAEGIGERLTPIELPQLAGYYLAVVRPDIPVPTKEAFALIKPQHPRRNCKDIVEKEPVEQWRHELINDFEKSVFTLHPEIGHIKTQLYEMGARYAAMSGSGSAVFGLFSSEPDLSGLFNGMFKQTMQLP